MPRVLLSLLAFVIALPLHAQNAMPKSGAVGSAEALKAAKKPKSDKWAFSLFPVSLQRNPQTEFTIITEMTGEGRKLPPPSFDEPVYYISHSVGQRDVGDSYGGTREIPYQNLEKQLNTALASNGYRPAGAEHPATQIFFIAWGMHNKIEPIPEDMDSGDDSDSGDSGGGELSYNASPDDIQNLLSRAKIVGGQKFAGQFAQALSDQLDWSGSVSSESRGPLQRFKQRDELTEALVDQIFEECYYLLVTSFDVEALKHGQKKILWTTKISTTSQGIAFETTLPNMIENGAYYFGREMAEPDIVRKNAYKRGSVELGEMSVVDYVTGTATGTTAPAASGTTSAKP